MQLFRRSSLKLSTWMWWDRQPPVCKPADLVLLISVEWRPGLFVYICGE